MVTGWGSTGWDEKYGHTEEGTCNLGLTASAVLLQTKIKIEKSENHERGCKNLHETILCTKSEKVTPFKVRHNFASIISSLF